MNVLRIPALVAVLLVLAPIASAAELGVRAGRYNDSGENFVGVEMVIDTGTINLNPNLEYSLADGETAGSVNLDVTFDILQVGRAVPYVGAGIGLAYLDVSGSSRTDVLGNLIAGVAFDLDFFSPYLQVKYFRMLENRNASRDDVALTVGLRF